ncbi:hypothetical protein [Nocardioides sp. AE5]|uniref:hypothetical protein n=1 Tax=Nocardioides sp. AE5 TaxID=2962573 RepID=UPI002880F31D|nr:hypothetical protein [Nocardioides sp. AE5]MDT0200747.1 hypothetical protein [Nocardioides sp. AE5]
MPARPRQSALPRSTALQAAAAAVLVLGVLLLLVLQGGSGDDAGNEEGGPVSVPARELEQGMTSIASDEFFETVIAAQRAAGTWNVLSVSTVDGRSMQPSVQQVSLAGDDPAIRTVFDSGVGTVEALYIGGDFYVKGFSGTETPWWKVEPDGEAGQLVTWLAQAADPTRFLSSLKEFRSFEVVGVEDVATAEEGTTVTAVHYRLTLDPPGENVAGTEATPMEMDMWVDADDRPVRVETAVEGGGQRLETTLFYVLYGEKVDIEAPPADQVTTETPPELAGRQ